MSTEGFILIQFLNTVSLAALLVCIAMGMTLIFGILRVINFAHGALYMLGAYGAYTIVELTGSFWLALLLAPLAVAAIGLAAERVMLRPLFGRQEGVFLLVTFGLALALTEVVRLGWGPHALNVPASPLLKDIVWLLDEPYPVYRLFLAAAGLMVTLGVWVTLQRTPFGLYVRASWQNPEMVEAVGINVNLIRNLVVGLGFGLAGFAGVLAAPLLTANMGMGIAVIVDTFVIVVIGGLGSIAGTVLAAFAIALLRVLGDFYFPEMAMASQFLLMALVLAFRPGGLLGKAEV